MSISFFCTFHFIKYLVLLNLVLAAKAYEEERVFIYSVGPIKADKDS